MKLYFKNVGTTLSQSVNTIFLLGDPDESISARAYRLGILEGKEGWVYLNKLINLLFFWEKDHCKISYYFDLNKAKKFIAAYERKKPMNT